jgi:hypothetical protein
MPHLICAEGTSVVIVYKYLHPKRIDVLKNNSIRFTQPAVLNDPFEMLPSLSKIRRDYAGLAEELGREMDPVSAAVVSITAQWRITDTFGRMQDDKAIDLAFLSLSKNRNNPLMWSHYCDSHHGFVVGFDSTDPFFLTDPGVKSGLQEVIYSSDRPVVPSIEGDWPKFLQTNTTVLTKSIDWKYEEELRMFAKPTAADVTEPGCDGHPIYLFKFPADSVREVILGLRTAIESQKEILEIVRNTYPKANLFKADLNQSRFDLDILPFSG